MFCMDQIELVSHAKVNLTLEVGERRADGYHEIDSVAQVIALTDHLIVERAPSGVIEVEADSPEAPSGRGNLVYKACKTFLSATGVRGGARCKLRKGIPAQAGLGGGSGNAAAAVVGLDWLYGTRMAEGALAGMAAGDGSDAALFVYGGTVRMRGRGELVEPLPDAPVLELVVVKPECGVSTVWAYAELDKAVGRVRRKAGDRAESAARAGQRSELVASLWNDFDPVVSAAVSEVGRAKEALASAGAQAVLLCGSGSAVFGVFESRGDAERAAVALEREFAYVAATRSLGRAECAAMVL